MSDRPPGTFLVRFSNSKMGSFTVTRMSSSKGVVNLRIDRDDNLKFNYLNSYAGVCVCAISMCNSSLCV